MNLGDSASFQKTITESDVVAFAGITGDFNPIHISKTEAQKSIFGERIAHGMLAASFISTVIGMYLPGPGAIYLEQDCKFLKPVKIGDTLTAICSISEIINREKGIVKLENCIVNQDNIRVVEGTSVVKVDSSKIQ